MWRLAWPEVGQKTDADAAKEAERRGEGWRQLSQFSHKLEATFIIHFEYFSLIAEGKIYVRHFGNTIPEKSRAEGAGGGGRGFAVGAQGSTPYPLANDLMLTYSGCRLLLLFRSISFPAAPLNLIKKLPPPMQMRRGQVGRWAGAWLAGEIEAAVCKL